VRDQAGNKIENRNVKDGQELAGHGAVSESRSKAVGLYHEWQSYRLLLVKQVSLLL
jgi:hypothetical protein